MRGNKTEKAEMKKAIFIYLSAITLVLLSLSNIGYASTFQTTATQKQASTDGEPTLQEWFNQNGYNINVTEDETGIEIFEAGYYKVTILAEIAAYAPMNNLSWYPESTGQLNYIFYGANATGDEAFFLAPEDFGLCLGSPDGFFYTEPYRNDDGEDHALVFVNPNASGYIIAWEDLWKLGDEDFQDFILAALTPVRVKVWYCPRTLNLKSRGRWITALIKIPEGYKAKDVNVSSVMLNGTVQADVRHYKAVDLRCLHLLIVKFNRTALISYVEKSVNGCACKRFTVSLIVTGEFSDGTPFYGRNTIRILCFNNCHAFSHTVRKLQHRFCSCPSGTHATPPRTRRVFRADRRSWRGPALPFPLGKVSKVQRSHP